MSGTPKLTIIEHRIPTPASGPYIICEGSDGALWFCESTASKIARFDPDRGTFREFALSHSDASPIGIIGGADGAQASRLQFLQL